MSIISLCVLTPALLGGGTGTSLIVPTNITESFLDRRGSNGCLPTHTRADVNCFRETIV